VTHSPLKTDLVSNAYEPCRENRGLFSGRTRQARTPLADHGTLRFAQVRPMAERTPNTAPTQVRDRQVRRVILIEGAANLAVLVLKVVVGVSTGSLAILSDALHSLTDVANNGLAYFVVRLSSQPADRQHPYGHRKFETLAVFALATLLTVLSFELVSRAFRREEQPMLGGPAALPLMIVVLLLNVSLAAWERRWAKKLDSGILDADARHTFADVLTTAVVLVGWQLSARGIPWLDSACAILVAGLVLWLAFGLFRRVIPVLVDRVAIDSDTVVGIVREVPGVLSVQSVRSRSTGQAATAVDMTVTVDPSITAEEAHEIADQVEELLRSELAIEDSTIHVEPGSPDPSKRRPSSD